MFIPSHDITESVIKHLLNFWDSSPDYKEKLDYWERFDYFISIDLGECMTLYLPYVFKKEQLEPFSAKNTTLFPVSNAREKKLFHKWLLRINLYRALEEWESHFEKMCQEGRNEAEWKIRKDFCFFYEGNRRFRETYRACYRHERVMFTEAQISDSSSYSSILTMILAELWFVFNRERNLSHFHKQFEEKAAKEEQHEGVGSSSKLEIKKRIEKKGKSVETGETGRLEERIEVLLDFLLEKSNEKGKLEEKDSNERTAIDILLEEGENGRLSDYIEKKVKEILLKNNDKEDTMSGEEAAIYLKISLATLYSYTSGKAIPHWKTGRKLLFSRKELEAWIKKEKTADTIKKEAFTNLNKKRKKKL